MRSSENTLAIEIESWELFGFALREENRILFHKMLNEGKKKKYVDCLNAKGKNLPAEPIFDINLSQS